MRLDIFKGNHRISNLVHHANMMYRYRYITKKPRQYLGFFLPRLRSRRELVAGDMIIKQLAISAVLRSHCPFERMRAFSFLLNSPFEKFNFMGKFYFFCKR